MFCNCFVDLLMFCKCYVDLFIHKLPPPLAQADRATNVLSGSKQEQLERVRRDLRSLRSLAPAGASYCASLRLIAPRISPRFGCSTRRLLHFLVLRLTAPLIAPGVRCGATSATSAPRTHSTPSSSCGPPTRSASARSVCLLRLIAPNCALLR